MATREKKPRSVNSDSPTPSLGGGGSDSAPSTPTSKGKGATNTGAGSMGNTGSGSGGSRASLSRQKSKQLLQNAASSEDTVQSAAADDVTDVVPSTTTSTTTTNRTTRATKDDSGEQSSKEKSTTDPKDSPKDSKPAATARKAATVTGKKKPTKGGGGNAKTTITALKRTTLIKRKTRPIVGKPVLGKKVLARKQINAKGKKEVTVTVKEQEDNKNTSLRNGKPRATDSPVSLKSRKTVVTPKDKSPKDAASSTPEPTSAVKVERRRSDSVSKCSDVTDASTLEVTRDDEKDDTSLSEIKREIMEEQETKSKILDKMAETFNERKTPIAAVVAAAKDEKAVRRSARQRKSTARDRDDFVTPKLKVPAEIKAEPVDTDETTAAAPLSIDTTENVTAPKETTAPSEKDASLSPELVSEGVSEISVKEFYSEPAFLENNLGIEQDPKLGEIVQVQEKIKLDKGGSESGVANGSEPPAASEKAEPDVVVKEEKMDVEEEVTAKDDKVKASESTDVEKVKEIIGVVATPVAKEETSGNESPASDWSNEKEATSSLLSGKVKKNDSRSDSDGERPPSSKQNTPRAAVVKGSTPAAATCKDQKPKTRNVKDKSKEDEKAKEEKLRQEKLRVEEKVREEKLRAERLKQEEEKKLLENKVLPEVEVTVAAAPLEVDAKKSPPSPEDSVGKQEQPKPAEEVVSIVEKVLPPVTVTTTLSLTSADSHLVLSVKSTESIDIVDPPKSDVAKLNAIALENLPAITFVKKDSVKDDTKLDGVQLKAELEIVPIKETVVVEEKPVEKDPETTLHIISKSESAAAAVTVTTVAATEAIPVAPTLSIIKIQTEKDSTNSAIFKENPVEKLEVKAPEAVKNRDSIEKVPPANETKTAAAVLRVPEVLPVEAMAGSSTVLEESDDIAKQKESHLKHLGLLTHQAASEEKQRRKELVLQKPSSGGSGGSGYSSSSSSGKGSGGKSSRNSESTGTLKTVIKLNRGEKRKRLPLKMTLQKGKGKGAEKDGANGGDGNGDAFYIIQNENDHQNQSMTDSTGAATTQGRKGHHRSHTTDGVNLPEVVAEAVAVVEKVVQKAPLVIPEKASSFNVHPERLCMDQCFYCGGKFGLYDTPCHIRAMKSTDRQQNILASETKIKIDSCLCDACFRHVDRKANCPSYRKKTEAKSLSLAKMQSSLESGSDRQSQNDGTSEKAGESSTAGIGSQQQSSSQPQAAAGHELDQADGQVVQGSCHVTNCGANACHTIRRKWLLKMKKTICKILEINLDQSNATMTLIPICDGHYERISHLMVCAMCQRRLPKNHIYYIVNEIPQLERLIQEQGIAIKLGNSTLVVCKLCRYYANLLLKPPDAKSQKAQFIKNYNRRLLQFYERDMEQQEQIVTNPDIIISDGEEDEPLEVVTVNDSISLQRRARQSRKSTDLTIIETGNCSSQVGDLDEVTITPAPKLLANISGNSSIVLDTDLSFEQPPSAEKRRKNDDGLDMTKALKANPNISMRELFPGEEELGIHINIPFNTASTRTPEGWAKVTTTLQYDDSTRSMWEELQKPYGNQSSFLRHLVLLEKYYRNGDLILSPQAKNNAVTYSEAVQSRLRSFDNIPTPPPISVIDKSSIMQQQLGNAPITITPAAKVRTKSSTEPVSLLKSNNPHLVSGESSTSSMKRKLSTDSKQKSTSSVSAKTDSSKIIKLDETVVVPSIKATSMVPPELISINAKQNVTITTIPANSKPSTAQSTQPPLQQQQQQQQSLLQPQQSLLQTQPQVKKSPGTGGTREIIKLPDQLTEAERRETSKPWRPTLIPITPGSAEAIKAGPLYQTADGRRLPKLVQVMSGGKPYHISINDYNRMCILRREKLLQQQQQLLIQQHHKRLQQQSPPSLTAIKPTNSKPSENPPKMVQIPNQILEQNSLIPIASNNNNNNSSAKVNGPSSELQQLIKTRKPNSTNSALVPPPLAANAASAFFKNAMGAKPLSLPNSTSVFSMPAPNQQQLQQQQQQPQPVAGEAPPPPSVSQLDQLIKLNNFVSQSQLNAFVAAAAAAAATTAPSLISGTSGGSLMMDSAAAQQLLKIPKSLTVIPQQKQRSLSRVSSNEDQSSA